MAVNRQVNEKITAYIRQCISKGDWQVGEKIPSENELCQILGVSRMSVRSAMHPFVVTGILESRQGKGTFLQTADLSLVGKGMEECRLHGDYQKLWQWHEARNLIEPGIVYKVATKVTPELLDTLDRLNRELVSHVGDQKRFIETDFQWHQALADHLGNPLISHMLHDLLQDMSVHVINNETFGYHGGLYYHMRITEAIRDRDPKKARALMEEHGREGQQMLEKAAVEQEDGTPEP